MVSGLEERAGERRPFRANRVAGSWRGGPFTAAPANPLNAFAQLDIPVSQVNEVFPAIVLVQAETDLHEGTPLRPLRFSDKMQPRFLRRAIGLERIAIDALHHQENDPGHTDTEGNGAHRLRMWLLLRKIVPFGETKRLKRAVAAVEDNLGVALKQQCQRASSRANIDRLPKAIEHQHMLVERRIHVRSNCRQTTQNRLLCQ